MATKKKPAAGETKKQFNVRLPVSIAKRLGHFMVEEDVKAPAVVAAALDEYLKKRGA